MIVDGVAAGPKFPKTKVSCPSLSRIEGYEVLKRSLNALAAVALVADLDQIERIVKVGGFVNGIPGFTAIPPIINGASELFIKLFGEDYESRTFEIKNQSTKFKNFQRSSIDSFILSTEQ